jgi:hypothetical protein
VVHSSEERKNNTGSNDEPRGQGCMKRSYLEAGPAVRRVCSTVRLQIRALPMLLRSGCFMTQFEACFGLRMKDCSVMFQSVGSTDTVSNILPYHWVPLVCSPLAPSRRPWHQTIYLQSSRSRSSRYAIRARTSCRSAGGSLSGGEIEHEVKLPDRTSFRETLGVMVKRHGHYCSQYRFEIRTKRGR